MALADSLRSSTVTMNDVAAQVEGVLPARDLITSGAARSQTGAATWALIASTGVAITIPNHCYVRQTINLSVSHNTNGALMAFTGARDLVSNRAQEAYCKATSSDTGGLVIPISLECIWKVSPGTYTFHIAWWSSDAGTRYTNISHNHVEAIREAAV
jgi:hypothetical protein